MFFLEQLIELAARIWDADTEIRDRSWFGESGLEREGRRFVAWLCGGTIILLAVAGGVWWWWNRAQ